MVFVVKAHIPDVHAKLFTLPAQKTMYGGKRIAVKDEIFIFASENEGGQGLIARGVVTSASTPVLERGSKRRATPRVSIVVRRLAPAKRRLGRVELRSFRDWDDGKPQTELCFKLYRQATNKVVGVTAATGDFLSTFF